MSNISLPFEELLFLRNSVLETYGKVWNSSNPSQFPILITNTYKHNYEALIESFKISLSRLLIDPKIPKNAINIPSESFWVRFFTATDGYSCRKANLNACYLYAFNKTYDEYGMTKNRSYSESEILETKHHVRNASYEDIRKIFIIASSVYQGIDVIPMETMLMWYEKNPLCFHVVINEYDEVVGNIDILPLTRECTKKFLEGSIIEREIQSRDIVGLEDKNRIEYLYIESLVSLGGVNALSELLRFIPYVLMDFGLDISNIKKIYCISASKRGQALIEKLGFKKIKSSEERKDKHDLFEHDIKELILAVVDIFKHKTDYSKVIGKL